MTKITDIFFDLDNTLWDFRKNSLCALEKMFSDQQIESKFKITYATFHSHYYTINETLWAEFRDEKIDSKHLKSQRFLQAFNKCGINNDAVISYFENNYLSEVVHFNHLVKDSLEVLKYLKPNYKIHVLTNGFEEVSHQKIENSGLTPYLTSITSAEELEIRKPNPKIYQFALAKGKAKAKTSAYIGDDWIADAIGAKNMGMKSVFFDALDENRSGEDITVIQNLIEVKNLF